MLGVYQEDLSGFASFQNPGRASDRQLRGPGLTLLVRTPWPPEGRDLPMSSTAGGGQRSGSRLLLPHLGTFPVSPPSAPNLFLHPDSFSETNDVGGVGFQVFIVGVFLVAG